MKQSGFKSFWLCNPGRCIDLLLFTNGVVEMLKKVSKTILFVVSLLGAVTCVAYDNELAESYGKLFESVHGAKVGKALHLMPADVFVESLKMGKEFVVLDVRTEAESRVYSMMLPNSLVIPMNKLFTAEHLGQLPTNETIIVVCKSGTRAIAVGTVLRHIGFDDVFILKGGFKALSAYLDAKTANMPPVASK